MSKKDKIGTVLLLLSPISFFGGLWLILGQLPALDAIPTIGAAGNIPPGIAIQLIIGAAFTTLGFLMFISSLGMYSSRTNTQARKWLWFLGRTWRLRILS